MSVNSSKRLLKLGSVNQIVTVTVSLPEVTASDCAPPSLFCQYSTFNLTNILLFLRGYQSTGCCSKCVQSMLKAVEYIRTVHHGLYLHYCCVCGVKLVAGTVKKEGHQCTYYWCRFIHCKYKTKLVKSR